jgi:cellulose biosynthesis protein BcsQ
LKGGSDGPTALEKLTNERRTISAYISLETEPHNMFKYQDFLVHPHEYNDKVPQNVFLLCGDHSLDLIAPAIERMANEIPIRGTRDPFKEIHSIVKRFVEAVTKEGEWIVWVDTNPAFTIYTRIALCTCQQLIVPCNPDEFSVSAVTVITDLLRGSNAPSAYNVTTFAKLAKQHSLELPKLRLVIANRFHVREGNTPLLYQGTQKRLADTFLSVLRKQENLDFVLPLIITKENKQVNLV